jgi:hypothetical protein
MSKEDYTGQVESLAFDLHVRGEVPSALSGSFIVPTSRRNKDRQYFSRWHDSQTDLLRLDLSPGRPGKIRVHVLPVDPRGVDLDREPVSADFDRRMYGASPAYGYATQPNHGVNIAGDTMWATNLLFGAPLEVDITAWKPRRILRYLELSKDAPRVSGTSHFAWSLDNRYAYFHQSLMERESEGEPVRAADLSLFELDVETGTERTWKLIPPPEDKALENANFHSGFYFEEQGRRYVGLLRTGALLETLAPHTAPVDHRVIPAQPSTIWIVQLYSHKNVLEAELLPGIQQLDGLALSHLDVDASSRDGFVLYANFKEADVGEETHGVNVYGERPDLVAEHYSGMTVEALRYGLLVRYERRRGATSVRTFSRPYDPGRTSLGHSWLPINIELDPSGRRLFCTFSGLRPRLLPRHIAEAYPDRITDPSMIRYVPPVLMRFDAETLEPELDGSRSHISYAEPMAMTVVGDGARDYVCTFSPEVGLRIYLADDLTHMVCRAESPSLLHWQDTHFRPEPAHMSFVHR